MGLLGSLWGSWLCNKNNVKLKPDTFMFTHSRRHAEGSSADRAFHP